MKKKTGRTRTRTRFYLTENNSRKPSNSQYKYNCGEY